ncbi:unnamed protein product [Closterium sp. Yama58-4]|nr:unnamed protein product [Closterium sp. Yama58-4]
MDWSLVYAVMGRWCKTREGDGGVEGACGDEEVEEELNVEEVEEVVEEDEEVVEEEEDVVEEEEEVVEEEEDGVEEVEVVEEEDEVVEEEFDGVSIWVVREEVEEEDEGLGAAVEGGREEGHHGLFECLQYEQTCKCGSARCRGGVIGKEEGQWCTFHMYCVYFGQGCERGRHHI